nr:MAG TPA: hypothetical protein [Caudoviricetes sp.]
MLPLANARKKTKRVAWGGLRAVSPPRPKPYGYSGR